MRCFFALELADAVRDRLLQVQERLRAWELEGRWVHPLDLHITLLYLGEVPDHEIGFLEHAVDEYCRHLLPPDLHLPGLGAFAGKGQPRIVYAAVGDPLGWCADVHHDLADCLSDNVEPHYRQHITLLRPDQGWQDGRWPAIFEGYGQADWGPCVVEALTLFISPDGARRGPRYEALRRWTW